MPYLHLDRKSVASPSGSERLPLQHTTPFLPSPPPPLTLSPSTVVQPSPSLTWECPIRQEQTTYLDYLSCRNTSGRNLPFSHPTTEARHNNASLKDSVSTLSVRTPVPDRKDRYGSVEAAEKPRGSRYKSCKERHLPYHGKEGKSRFRTHIVHMFFTWPEAKLEDYTLFLFPPLDKSYQQGLDIPHQQLKQSKLISNPSSSVEVCSLLMWLCRVLLSNGIPV